MFTKQERKKFDRSPDAQGSTPRSTASGVGKKKKKLKKADENEDPEKKAHEIKIQKGKIFVGGLEQGQDRVFKDAVP